MDDLEFRLKKIFSEATIAQGLSINTDRFQVRKVEDSVGNHIIQGILLLAVQEEEVWEYPDNFLTRWGKKWQNFKKNLPRWMRLRVPLKVHQVWAIHKYPDVNVPIEFIGSEFVHFQVKEFEDDSS